MPLFENSVDAASVVVFGVVGVVVGSVVEILLKNFKVPIPYTVVLFYLGIFVGLVTSAMHISTNSILALSAVSSNLIVYGFLPTLLFSETMNLNWHHLRQSFGQAITLAGPGGVIVCMLIAVLAKGCLPFQWDWNYCFLFGAILCATDPVSCVALLKATKASSKLTMAISGESLLNDGSAMILYLFFYNIINGRDYTFATFLGFAAEMILVSPLIGYVLGIVTGRIMRRIDSPTSSRLDIQVTLTVICAYLSFYIAEELLNISGVLACCTAGVTVSLFAPLKVLSDHKFHRFWESMEWGCNTLIFLLAGLIGGSDSASAITGENIAFLFIFYGLLLIVRTVMVFGLSPALNKAGNPFSVEEMWFTVYAGLRGALCIALALEGANNASEIGYSETGKQLFFMVAGLASLTLLLNGSTAGMLLLRLKLVDDPAAPVSAQLIQVLYRIKMFMKAWLHRELTTMKKELGRYNEQELIRLVTLMHPEYGVVGIAEDDDGGIEASASVDRWDNIADKNQADQDDDRDNNDREERGVHLRTRRYLSNDPNLSIQSISKLRNISVRVSGSTVIDPDLLAYTRETFLAVLRARYEDSIHTGKIGTSSFSSKLLLHSLDVAMDYIHEKLYDWKVILKFLHPNRYLLQAASTIDNLSYLVGGYMTGLVSRIDAYYERIAMYVLTNFIDAHEFAQSRMHFFLGGMLFLGGNGENDIAGPEERHVLLESQVNVERARSLLATIKPDDLLLLYTHRAAKVIIQKQGEILHKMVEEGILSEKNAKSLFESYESERDQLHIERHRQDRHMLKENIIKKMEEEKEFRESIKSQQSGVEVVGNLNAYHSNHNNSNNNNNGNGSATVNSPFHASSTAGDGAPITTTRSSFRMTMESNRQDHEITVSAMDRLSPGSVSSINSNMRIPPTTAASSHRPMPPEPSIDGSIGNASSYHLGRSLLSIGSLGAAGSSMSSRRGSGLFANKANTTSQNGEAVLAATTTIPSTESIADIQSEPAPDTTATAAAAATASDNNISNP